MHDIYNRVLGLEALDKPRPYSPCCDVRLPYQSRCSAIIDGAHPYVVGVSPVVLRPTVLLLEMHEGEAWVDSHRNFGHRTSSHVHSESTETLRTDLSSSGFYFEIAACASDYHCK